MINTDEGFQKFKGRLELTEAEQKDASRRQRQLRELLRDEFAIERDFLSGSYARWTKTKPLKDVDVFFVLDSEAEADLRKKGPAEVIRTFRIKLAKSYGNMNVSESRRSVEVRFGHDTTGDGEGVMSIDVVPAFTAGNHYEIPDGTLGKWIATNPEVHAALATSANKAISGEWKPLVKMLKKWNEESDKPIRPSFLIEVMALELFVPPFSGGYPYELKGFFATAAERIGERWADPAGLGPDVSDQMDAHRVHGAVSSLLKAEEATGHAIRLASDGRQGDALRCWRELFGDLFPLS